MKKIVKYIFIPGMVLLLLSCEEEIHIDLNNSSPMIVIDGRISDQSPCLVKLSHTTDYFKPGLPDPVSGASVVLKDALGSEEVMEEIVTGTYRSIGSPGVPGTIYTLMIGSTGKSYSASSTMPAPVAIDSLKAEYVLGGRFFDSGYFIHLYFKDPPGIRNYYRMKSYRNTTENVFLHLFDDRLSDGLNIHYFFFNEGYQPGDTAVIELNGIGFESYDYLLTLSTVSAANQGGPGSTPANPNTNFSNGALGYFSAYTVDMDTIIIEVPIK